MEHARTPGAQVSKEQVEKVARALFDLNVYQGYDAETKERMWLMAGRYRIEAQAAIAAYEQSRWLPIESAPKDGRVLLWNGRNPTIIKIGEWSTSIVGDNGYWLLDDDNQSIEPNSPDGCRASFRTHHPFHRRRLP
jgi:hypothetical protein